MDRIIKKNHIYRHFKGMYVYIENIALDSETQKEMIIYRHLGDDTLWVREKEMFLSKTDKEKYPDIKQEYRFEEVDMTKEKDC